MYVFVQHLCMSVRVLMLQVIISCTTEHPIRHQYFANTLSEDSEDREKERERHTHGAIVCTASVMTDKAMVLNGGGGGVATVGGANGSQPPDVMDSWKRVAQINMKALELVS